MCRSVDWVSGTPQTGESAARLDARTPMKAVVELDKLMLVVDDAPAYSVSGKDLVEEVNSGGRTSGA